MRTRMIVSVATLYAATLFFATGVWSQEDRTSYLVLKAGPWSLRSDNLTNENTGSYGEIALGGKFNPYLGMEFGVGYLSAEGAYRSSRADVRTTPVLLSLRVGVPIVIVEPYFLLGGGAYFTTIDIGSTSTSTVKAGYHAALGVDVNLGPLLVGAEARYFETTGKTFDADINLHGYILAAKAGIRF